MSRCIQRRRMEELAAADRNRFAKVAKLLTASPRTLPTRPACQSAPMGMYNKAAPAQAGLTCCSRIHRSRQARKALASCLTSFSRVIVPRGML
jgi:hypothetical protein